MIVFHKLVLESVAETAAGVQIKDNKYKTTKHNLNPSKPRQIFEKYLQEENFVPYRDSDKTQKLRDQPV